MSDHMTTAILSGHMPTAILSSHMTTAILSNHTCFVESLATLATASSAIGVTVTVVQKRTTSAPTYALYLYSPVVILLLDPFQTLC